MAGSLDRRVIQYGRRASDMGRDDTYPGILQIINKIEEHQKASQEFRAEVLRRFTEIEKNVAPSQRICRSLHVLAVLIGGIGGVTFWKIGLAPFPTNAAELGGGIATLAVLIGLAVAYVMTGSVGKKP
jgi:hypothetical protein